MLLLLMVFITAIEIFTRVVSDSDDNFVLKHMVLIGNPRHGKAANNRMTTTGQLVTQFQEEGTCHSGLHREEPNRPAGRTASWEKPFLWFTWEKKLRQRGQVKGCSLNDSCNSGT